MVPVPNAPGQLEPVLRLVADVGVNVEYAYGAGSDGSSSVVVLGVDDALRAATAAGV